MSLFRGQWPGSNFPVGQAREQTSAPLTTSLEAIERAHVCRVARIRPIPVAKRQTAKPVETRVISAGANPTGPLVSTVLKSTTSSFSK